MTTGIRKEQNELAVPADDLHIMEDPITLTWRLRGKFVDEIKRLYDDQKEQRLPSPVHNTEVEE